MKILLVYPANENDLDRRVIKELPFLKIDTFFAPHACAVVAALTPREHEVRIHDEAVNGPVETVLDQESFDIVGMSLVANAYVRAIDIARRFREAGKPGVLVAGGACMLHMVDKLREDVDVVFVGEAEETWPQFLEDYSKGKHGALYRQIAKPDLAKMPVPRWDLLREDLHHYSLAAVQTVRGCPHDCAFCDVIYIYGRKLRFKPMDQVIEEIKLLADLGVEMVFFSDDNFAANRKHTKALLHKIVELNKTLDSLIGFSTQVDITVAEDDELLQLMLDANFLEVQIGIESVKPESLKDIHKQHNLRYDLVDAVRKIQSYGIIVLSHLIVGMDSDDASAFEITQQFVTEANVIHQACHPLMAPPGTKLWYQLRMEGRLVEVSPDMQDRMDLYTNVVPKQMSRIELIEGLTKHRLQVSAPEAFFDRMLGFIEGVTHQPSFKVTNEPPARRNLGRLFTMIRYYLFTAEKAERKLFFQLLKLGRKYSHLMPKVFYGLVCHSMELRHAEIKAEWAEEITAMERAMPNGPDIMSKEVVVAPGVRDSFKQITRAAYQHVRKEVADRETLYGVVVEALSDYALTFGAAFETFDDYQLDAVQKSCDRVVSSRKAAKTETDNVMPEENPPPGFTREIMDAMDQTMRFGLKEAR